MFFLHRRHLRLATTTLALVAASCSQPTYVATGHIDGTVSGTIFTGKVGWAVRQTGDQVVGSGTFLKSGDSTVATYTVRGRWQGQNLSVRLVGAPGDSDADSVWYTGRQAFKDYVGLFYDGTIQGNSKTMYGPLALFPK